jgi:hypothetical protein
MADPKAFPNANPYNQYSPSKGENFQRAHEASYVRDITLRAFEELQMIGNWAEFVAICEEQKRKRGW